jgi:long-subunit fatty acid transport protein
MSGALTADATDFTAVFYNPAMLVLREDASFGFSFDYTRTDATVRTVGTAAGRELDCTYCDPTDWTGVDLGLLFPLGGKVQNRLALGLGMHLPASKLVSVRAVDPNRPFWYDWNNAPDRMVVFLGAGIRLTERLSLGLGMQALGDLEGRGADVTMDLFSKEVRFREVNSDFAPAYSPNAALHFVPLDGLRLGLSWRGEFKHYYQLPANIDLQGIGVLALSISGYNHFTPHTFTAGAAWDPLEQLTVALDLSYQRWSAAPSPHTRIVVDMSGATLEALGLDEVLDLDTQDLDPSSPGFEDTLSVRLGVEYRLDERWAARGGLSFRPTPVPLQTQLRTNILDADAVGVSAGIGWSFEDPLELFARPLILDVALQGLWYLNRTAQKADTDPVPSYEYGLRVFGTSVALRYDF